MNNTTNNKEQILADFYKQHAERIEIAKKIESQRELATNNNGGISGK